MFYARQKTLVLAKPVTETDRTGFESKSYKDAGTVNIYIVKKGANAYRTNELNLVESEFVGYSQEKLEVGDRLDGKYIVDYVAPIRTGYAYSLSSWSAANG